MPARPPLPSVVLVPLVLGTVVLGLAACGPVGPQPSASPSGSVSSSSTADTATLVLPEDAVLGLSGVVTAANGATADVRVIVHAPAAQDSAAASEARTATLEWCVGEVDDGMIVAQDFHFVTVDVELVASSGDWPTDAQLLVLPEHNGALGSTLAVSPGLHQVEIVDSEESGDYVPHCLQPAFLDGAGSGSVYLGIPGDVAGWTLHDFGLSAVLPGGVDPTPVTFSDCEAIVTDLGTELGVPGPGWRELFEDDVCAIGGGSST